MPVCILPVPMDGVPYLQPLKGKNHSLCRGEGSVSGPLATPPGGCHCGPLAYGPRCIPP